MDDEEWEKQFLEMAQRQKYSCAVCHVPKTKYQLYVDAPNQRLLCLQCFYKKENLKDATTKNSREDGKTV